MGKCQDHLDFASSTCPDCGLPVNKYGNTEDQFDNCSFPDCGCDGSRLCMANDPNDLAATNNVEGMWSAKTEEQRRAALGLMAHVSREEKSDAASE